MWSFSRFLPACALLLFFAGCDAMFGIGPTEIYGHVVDAETGEPMESVRVSFIVSGGYAAYSTEAFTLTDADGHFELAHDFPDGNWISVWVNSLGTMEEGCHLISHSGGPVDRVEPGERTRLDIELPRNHYYDPEGQPETYPSPVRCWDWSDYDV